VHLLSPDSGPIGERPKPNSFCHRLLVRQSHLIGRLFEALSERAIRVYIPPFETTSTYWKSILFLAIDELDQATDPSHWSPEQPTQLDASLKSCFDNSCLAMRGVGV